MVVFRYKALLDVSTYSQQKHLKRFSKATKTWKDKFVTLKTLYKSGLRSKREGGKYCEQVSFIYSLGSEFLQLFIL